MQITTVGLDIAKLVFQVHGVDAEGNVVMRRRLSRGQVRHFFAALSPCLVGIEACGTAHYWARELQALGHDVRLMPAHYVKPYVKRQKNDAADAEAICEAVTRPSMRFVPVKTPQAQALALIHRIRTQFVEQRTAMLNALRAGLAEFGIIAAQGHAPFLIVVGNIQRVSHARPLTTLKSGHQILLIIPIGPPLKHPAQVTATTLVRAVS